MVHVYHSWPCLCRGFFNSDNGLCDNLQSLLLAPVYVNYIYMCNCMVIVYATIKSNNRAVGFVQL